MFLHHVLRHRALNFVIQNLQMSCFFTHFYNFVILKKISLRFMYIVQQYFVQGIQRSKNRETQMRGRWWKTMISDFFSRKWTNWLKVDKPVFYWYYTVHTGNHLYHTLSLVLSLWSFPGPPQPPVRSPVAAGCFPCSIPCFQRRTVKAILDWLWKAHSRYLLRVILNKHP